MMESYDREKEDDVTEPITEEPCGEPRGPVPLDVIIEERLLHLPDLMKEVEDCLQGLLDTKELLDEQLSSTERSIFKIVTEETTPEGKASFSNEKARDTETRLRCKENLGYAEMSEKVRKINANIGMKKRELELMSRQWSSAKYLVGLLEARNISSGMSFPRVTINGVRR